MGKYTYLTIISLLFIICISGELWADAFEIYDLRPAAVIILDGNRDTYQKVREIAKRAGARGVQGLIPDAIYGRFPSGLDQDDFAGLPVSLVRSASEIVPGETSARVYQVLKGLFNERQYVREFSPVHAGPPDLPVAPPPQISEGEFAGKGPRVGTPAEIRERGIQQNSEFLIGDVLINVILPESGLNGSEDWTAAEINDVFRDVFLGLSQYLQSTHWVDLEFHVNSPLEYQRVEVSFEPIEGDWNTDGYWILECLEALGYDNDEFLPPYFITHRLNNDTRKELKMDWVFTAYIADASVNGCWQGPAGSYAAYTIFLGGPYVVVPYPACRFGTGLNFGHVLIHEMSHVFWALDEYASAGAECVDRSGYLNYVNGNSYYNGCGEGLPCIMNNAILTEPLPVCKYTMGQVGLADDLHPGLSIPDIYEINPTVEFLDFFTTDTTFDGRFNLSAEIRNPARQNENPDQDEGSRIHYAPALVKGRMLNSRVGVWKEIQPAIVPWDSSYEDVILIGATGLRSGSNKIYIEVTNEVGLKGIDSTIIKFVGLHYYSNTVKIKPESFDIEWKTDEDIFGADFDIYKENVTQETGLNFLAQVDGEDYISRGGDQRYYRYTDEDVQPTHKYRYRIVGSFTLSSRPDTTFSYPTEDIYQVGMIPVASGDILSPVLPNPTFDGQVNFTIKVPQTNISTSSSLPAERGILTAAAWEVKTDVKVTIYNVKGETVRNLFEMPLYGNIYPQSWDGLDNRGNPVSSGIYFIKVKAGNSQSVKKIVILK
ncbi:MAG: T9SS type A sorting domain-containing protein [Candidatus Krumholzibacteriota bacterium]|nr:T9SS type A sorting domain-containing protein [Candidatus Krumholzibacteriota bacterium]